MNNDFGSLASRWPPDYTAKEYERVEGLLRAAKPAFLLDGFGLPGRKQPTVMQTTDWQRGQIIRQGVPERFTDPSQVQ
jgi:hypothetical protein